MFSRPSMMLCLFRMEYLYGQFSQIEFTKFQIEGLKSHIQIRRNYVLTRCKSTVVSQEIHACKN